MSRYKGADAGLFNNLSQVELGHALGKDRRTINRWTKDGLPRNKDKTYSLPKIITWLLEREKENLISDKAMQSGSDSPALERYREARASMAEFDLKVKEESLIEIDEVHRQWALRVSEVCSGLEFLADRLSSVLPGKSRDEVKKIVDDEVWRLRDNYARAGKYCESE